MVSAPNSPVKELEDKENSYGYMKKNLSRRHSLAPMKSILKNSSLSQLSMESDSNHTIAVMQQIRSMDTDDHTGNITSNRRVSFAPEVTLHKIDMIPQSFEPSPRRQPRRRDTLQFISPLTASEDGYDDHSSDMEIESYDSEEQNMNKASNPFLIYQDEAHEAREAQQEQNDEDDSEFNSLFDEDPNGMDLTYHLGHLKTDTVLSESNVSQDMDITTHSGELHTSNTLQQDMELTMHSGNLQSSNVQDQDMEMTVHHGMLQSSSAEPRLSVTNRQNSSFKLALPPKKPVQEDMDITQHQGKFIEQSEEMDLTESQANFMENNEEMDITQHQSKIQEQEEPQDMELTEVVIKRQSIIQPDLTSDREQMDLTQHVGLMISESSQPLAQSTQTQLSQPLAQSTQSQSSEPQLASKQLSHITEVSETEEEEPLKNLLLQRVKNHQNSSFNFDSSEMEGQESVSEPTVTAFGDPSLIHDILRVTGGSQDDMLHLETQEQLPVMPTPNKRSFSTPKKATLTAENGSPQERSSSLKKRKLSFTPNGKSLILDNEQQSPTTQSQVPSSPAIENSLSDSLSTPVKDSVILSSPKDADTNIELLIQSLTPNRTKKRESFGYVSQSPRRRSISDEMSLTPLRMMKESSQEGLNLKQAVVTTIVPLASEEVEMADITDDYEPVEFKTFLKAAGIKFYDDLNVRDNSNDLTLAPFDHDSVGLVDYLSGLQKLKRLELINFSCNELRKNIEEGKLLFENLDKEVSEENPPLIREYFEATDQVQNTMNIQFQVLKNYARQQAKSVWYTWRSKLVEGVRQGLILNKRSLEDSRLKLDSQIDQLTSEQRESIKQVEFLTMKLGKLMQHKLEFEKCDKDELMSSRSKLISISNECLERGNQLEVLKSNLSELAGSLDSTQTMIADLNQEVSQLSNKIKESEIFSGGDVHRMQIEFAVLERITGLTLVSFESDVVKMQIGNVGIAYDTTFNTSDFQLRESDSLIINKFQHSLVDRVNFTIEEQISTFLRNYRMLQKIDDKFNKLRLYSNDPIKFIDLGEKIIVQIKEIYPGYKRLINIPVDSQILQELKVKLEQIHIEIISYNAKEIRESYSTDIEELEKLLSKVMLI